jgi:helicase
MSFDVKTAQRAFMIIDKDPYHKKKNYYNIYIFKLIEDNKDQGILRYNDKPIFKGMVQFEQIGKFGGFDDYDGLSDSTEDGIMEPFRFWKRINPVNVKDLKHDVDQNLKPLNPRIFSKLFKNARFIVIPSDQIDETKIQPIYDIAERLQNPKTHEQIEIRRYLLCDHCIKKRKFTLLENKDYFIGLNKKKICKKCAGIEVFSIMKKNYDLDISSELKIIMVRKLLKFRSIRKITKIFLSNFDPLKEKELTLYDRKSESKNLLNKIRKIGNLSISELDIPQLLKIYYKNQGIVELLPIQTISIKQGLLKNDNLLVISSTSSGKTLIGEIAGLSKILLRKIENQPAKINLNGLNQKEKEIAQSVYRKSLLKLHNGGKMLYLVPIVALASMRFEEYKSLKKIGIVPTLKVGRSYMDSDRSKEFGSIKKSDIIIGTYEALDILLRSGGRNPLGEVHTIVIDEIQMLNDYERGWVLDGLIARLKILYPFAQYIFLSATISDPKILSNHYKCKLIEFKGRPVPMERHLILKLNDFEKLKTILLYSFEEFKIKSKNGFKGQSLVFTNSRRKCNSIAQFLKDNGVSSASYHGGLNIRERRIIESKFSKQVISTVVTTAALAAGVDFPASQVIFESLAMGIKWLSVAEFEQMSGRAGRFGKHDLAKVIIIVEPGKSYHSGMVSTEEKTAINLLKGRIEPILMNPDEDRMYTEVLAFISMRSGRSHKNRNYKNKNINSKLKWYFDNCGTRKEISEFHARMLNNQFNLNTCLVYLHDNGFIKTGNTRPNGTHEICVTDYGKASASSFYPISICLKIKDSLLNEENLFNIYEEEEEFEEEGEIEVSDKYKINQIDSDNMKSPENESSDKKTEKGFEFFEDNLPINIAIDLNPMKNIYVSNAVMNEIKSKDKSSKSSTLLFSNSTMSLIGSENLGNKRKLSKFLKDLLEVWTREIFNCSCQNSPYCECSRRNVQKKLIELRLEGRRIDEILKWMKINWFLKFYSGDLFDYFDTLIHNLKSICNIGNSLNVSELVIEEIRIIDSLIKDISS